MRLRGQCYVLICSLCSSLEAVLIMFMVTLFWSVGNDPATDPSGQAIFAGHELNSVPSWRSVSCACPELIWSALTGCAAGTSTTVGALLVMWCSLTAYSSMAIVPSIVLERPLYLKERADGLYT